MTKLSYDPFKCVNKTDIKLQQSMKLWRQSLINGDHFGLLGSWLSSFLSLTFQLLKLCGK